MDEGSRAAGPGVAGDRSPEEIRADIERTREEVGDTVEALAAKTDVKAQAQQRVEEIKDTVRAKADQAKAKAPDGAQDGVRQAVETMRSNQTPMLVGGAVLAAFLIGRRSGRRRR